MADVTGSPLPDEPPEPTEPDAAGVAGSVTGEWVEVYQPDGTPADDEPTAQAGPPPHPMVLAVVVLFAVSLLLVVVGSVLPLFRAAAQFLDRTDSYRTTVDILTADAWQLRTVDNPLNPVATAHSVATPVPLGYPLALAAVLLLAAVALWLKARQQAGAVRAAKPVGLVAAAFLAGMVIAVGMFEVGWGRLASADAVEGLQPTIGLGYWLLVIGAVVGIVAAVLAHRVAVAPEPEPDEPERWPSQPADPDAERSDVPPGQPTQWPVVAVIPADERTNW